MFPEQQEFANYLTQFAMVGMHFVKVLEEVFLHLLQKKKKKIEEKHDIGIIIFPRQQKIIIITLH